MTFDDRAFLIFFPAFFVAYYLLQRSLRAQNTLIVIGSCIFYGSWNWRFLGLLLVSAGIDYWAGLLLGRQDRSDGYRKRVLAVSMVSNLGILFAFKYFDFFATSFSELSAAFGWHVRPTLLHVVLPVGISFYTFQSMSYTIDIYRRQVEPEPNPITYYAFVSFFPHMVAGPIQRAKHLLTQLERPRTLTYENVREAVWLLAWGYFLKEVVANGAAPFVDLAFAPDQKNGSMAILGSIAFGVEIYADFNAYSVIARGLGRLLGIEFIWNFDHPYFSSSIQDFWRRWHISLSTWLREYLYIPLGGNRRGRVRTYLNLFTTMLLGGLWHGAAWNFVAWGALHGGALAVDRFYGEWRKARGIPAMPKWVAWFPTMVVVFAGWFLFRCSSWPLLRGMTLSLRSLSWGPHEWVYQRSICALAAPAALIEIWQFRRNDRLVAMSLDSAQFALLTGVLVAFAVAMFQRFQYAFIYFQF